MAGLLLTAVTDARSLDRSQYKPSSQVWHRILEYGFCLFCLAGSLIAGTLELPSDLDLSPSMFSDPTMDKLQAINLMRMGDWCCAFQKIHGYSPPPAIRARLYELGIPQCTDFYGWLQIEAHLQSLELIIPRLRAIEQDARAIADQS